MASPVLSLDEFVENPTTEQLMNISFVDWTSIANHYQMSIYLWEIKKKKNVVVEVLVEQGVLEEYALTPAGFPPHDVERTPPQEKCLSSALDAENYLN